MVKSMNLSTRRPLYWMAAICLGVLMFSLAACGGDNSSATSNTGATNSSQTNSQTSAQTGPQKATVNITIKETKDASGKVTYTTDMPSLTVNKGDTVHIINQTSEDLDFDSGDAAKAGVDVIVPGNFSADAPMNIPGTFAIKTKSGASFSITVNP